MKAVCTLLAAGLVAMVSPLRADFVSTATLTPGADGATTSMGSGTATVDWMSATDTFTYRLSWTNLTDQATMAHIHFGALGVNGPIVIPFFMTPMPASAFTSGTLTAADFKPDPVAGINSIADVATAIQDGNAYVNIHTATYPAGELRGQLGIVPEPADAGFMLLALTGGAAVLFRRRRQALTRPLA